MQSVWVEIAKIVRAKRAASLMEISAASGMGWKTLLRDYIPQLQYLPQLADIEFETSTQMFRVRNVAQKAT